MAGGFEKAHLCPFLLLALFLLASLVHRASHVHRVLYHALRVLCLRHDRLFLFLLAVPVLPSSLTVQTVYRESQCRKGIS